VVDLSWRTGPGDDAVAAIRVFVAEVTAADGVAPLSEDALLHLHAPDTAQLLATTGAGELAGVAHLDPGEPAAAAAELAVHPGHRRAGLGTRMVRALLERVGPDGHLRVWAHGEHPGAVAIAQRLGFTRTRELWQMRRPFTGDEADLAAAAAALPDGVRLRPFEVGRDEAEFLRVNNAAFAWHPEQGGWDLDQITLRQSEPWFDPAGFLLAVDADDRLLGYHWTKVHPGDEPIGEVYVVGVDPAEQGRHLGRALTAAGLVHLRERGLPAVMLYVEADNTAAVRVYEKLGFARWRSDIAYSR